MFKLIKTDLAHTTFCKPFFIAAAILLYLSLREASNGASTFLSTEVFYYGIPAVCAVALLNAHSEKSSGGVRNKTIAGYTKIQIILAQIISSVICSVILFLIIGIPVYYSEVPSKALFTILSFLTMYAAIGAICTCITVCMTHAAAAVVVILGIGFFCFAITYVLHDTIKEPEYYIEYVFDESMVEEYGYENSARAVKKPNSLHVSGFRRVLLKTIAYVDPASQFKYLDDVLMVYTIYEHPFLNPKKDKNRELELEYAEDYTVFRECVYFPIYSVGLLLTVTAVGVVVFRKKELN